MGIHDDSLTVAWRPPAVIAPNLAKDDFKYNVNIKGTNDGLDINEVTADTSLAVDGIDELEAHSVKLSWTPPTNLVTGSEIKHYTISYTYMSGHNKMEKKVQGDITSTLVTDLVSGIQYNFKIKM